MKKPVKDSGMNCVLFRRCGNVWFLMNWIETGGGLGYPLGHEFGGDSGRNKS